MGNTNSLTTAQHHRITALAKGYTPEQVTKLIKATGAAAPQAADENTPLERRISHLTERDVSILLEILEDNHKAATITQTTPKGAPVLSEKAVAARDELIAQGKLPGNMVTSPESYPEHTDENILAFYTEYQRRVTAGEPVGPFDFTFHNFVRDRKRDPQQKNHGRAANSNRNTVPNLPKEQWEAMCGTGDADIP